MKQEDELKNIIQPLMEWYRLHARSLPWRRDKDPYRIWVSEIMLQQTRIETVLPYYERFMKELPNVEALAQCEDDRLHKLWEGLGYYSRVRNLKKAAILIMEQHQGILPKDYEALKKLPGIGEYTAGAIASMAYDLPYPAVDGNVLRVLTRVLADANDIKEDSYKKGIIKRLKDLYPSQEAGLLTQGIMELGEVICVPNREPFCENCPIKEFCLARKQNNPTAYPTITPRTKRKKQYYEVYRIRVNGLVLLHKRPSKGLLADLWEYPNYILDEKEYKRKFIDINRITSHVIDSLSSLQKAAVIIASVSEVSNQKHIFTHVEWHMKCYEVTARIEEMRESKEYALVNSEKLKKEYALPSAFLKLFKET